MRGALETALFVAALLAAGLVVGALGWSGVAPYADMARDKRVQEITFVGQSGEQRSFDLPAVLDLHRRWSAYVTGGTAEPPRFEADVRFTEDEYRHMADVRRVFDAARLAVPLALVVIIVRLQRRRAHSSRQMWELVRRGALIAAGLVTLVGLVAALAFEPLFLLFHYVFFPQGNFLFDPAASNLVRLYPEWYWIGVTLRVGATFIAAALALAALAALRLVTTK